MGGRDTLQAVEKRASDEDWGGVMAEAACMFGPHACRRAALEALVGIGMAVGGRKGMASRILGGLTMVDMASSVIDGWTGRKVQVQCHWVGMKRPK